MWAALITSSILILAAGMFQLRQQGDLPAAKPLFEQGQAAKLNHAPAAPTEIAVVSYNIRWRTGDELERIATWLKSKQALIVALQEVDRSKERTGKINNARALAESVGMYYAWAAPPLENKEEDTGVELLSAYPLTDVTPLVLRHRGPGRWRAALGATVKLGKTSVRVYSVHSETRMDLSEKLDQYRTVLDDLARLPKTTPAIVMGDFNSWEPPTVDAVRQLFEREGFSTPFPDDQTTFKRSAVVFDVKLKLDWIWLRRLKANDYEIDRALTVSDHFPLRTVVSLPQPAE